LAALVGTQVDFAFIDGQKSQYGQYLAKLQPLLQPGAIVVLDDVIKFRNKLDWLYSYLSQKQIIYRVEHIEDDDGVMICEF
jgi:predicted O-methyltransferase YrrM